MKVLSRAIISILIITGSFTAVFAQDSDPVKDTTNESSTDIVFRDLIIMTVNELEAAWYSLPPEEIAQNYSSTISRE
jgi:hypothetical protein